MVGWMSKMQHSRNCGKTTMNAFLAEVKVVVGLKSCKIEFALCRVLASLSVWYCSDKLVIATVFIGLRLLLTVFQLPRQLRRRSEF